MKKILSVILLTAFLICSILSICCVAEVAPPTQTLTVGAGKMYETITQALNNVDESMYTEILVSSGTYHEKVVVDTPQVTLFGEGEVVLDGDGLSTNSANMITVEADGVYIKNIKMTNLYAGLDKSAVGIRVHNASHVTIDNCEVYNLGCDYEGMHGYGYNSHGIIVECSKGKSVEDVTVQNCYIHDLKCGTSEALVFNGNIDGFVCKHNIVKNIDNIGIDFIGYERTLDETYTDYARNGVCEGNLVLNCSSETIEGVGCCAGGIYVDGGQNIELFNNIVLNCDIGMEISTEHNGKTVQGCYAHHNYLINNNALAGFSIGGCESDDAGYALNNIVKNNVIYNTDNACVQFQLVGSNQMEANTLIAAGDAEAFCEDIQGEGTGVNTIIDEDVSLDIQIDYDKKTVRMASSNENVLPSMAWHFLAGDATEDMRVDMKDVLAIRMVTAHVYPETKYAFCDANFDSSIDMKDVLFVRKIVANIK